MARLFPSAKDTLLEMIGLNSGDTAPSVSTAGNYISFLGYSNNVKETESYPNSEQPAYGVSPINVSGYPSFTISGDILAYIDTGSVTTISVGTPGSGYTSAPAVSFTGGGGGSGAAATAIINSAGQVSRVWVTNGGSGYTAAPTVVFTGGGGTLAAATAVINQYSDAQLDLLKRCEFLALRTSPFGITAGIKRPYYYGTISPTGLTWEFPSNGVVKISLSGKGSGTVLRGEW
jgi:hypothetical protein